MEQCVCKLRWHLACRSSLPSNWRLMTFKLGGTCVPRSRFGRRVAVSNRAFAKTLLPISRLSRRNFSRKVYGPSFFVLLTMSVFVLLTLKYAEVSARFPEGGGVVTVAAQAMNSWVGALGGMFILVSYFFTAAISCLSAIQYFSVVLPAIGPIVLEITIVVLLLLGLLNWVGISESAKVSLVGALIAFGSDLA